MVAMSKDKLTTQELIDLLAQKAGVSKKTAEDFLKALFLTIEDSLLAGDFVKIKNFGTFKQLWNEPRKSVNVRTGEEIQIEGFNKVVFVPDNKLKELVNEPYAHLEPLQLDDDVREIKTEPVEETYSPLQIFTEQASEIKDILSEINALSAMHSAVELETDIESEEIALPIDEQQDYLGTLTENSPSSEAEVVEVESVIENVIEDVELVELVLGDDKEEFILTPNVVLKAAEAEIIDDAKSELNNEVTIADSKIEAEKVEDEIIVPYEPETSENELESNKGPELNGHNEPLLIQSDNTLNYLAEEINTEESVVSNEVDTFEPIIDKEDVSSLASGLNQLTEPDIPFQKPNKKKGCLIVSIVFFALLAAFVVNYYLSSATRCWIKYTLLSEQNSDKVSNLKLTSSEWFTAVKTWFEKKPEVELKEQVSIKVEPNTTSMENTDPDTIENPQNNVMSVQGKLSVDSVESKVNPNAKVDAKSKTIEKIETNVKAIEKEDDLNQLFDGPRIYKSFLGTVKINEGSRLTLISESYYGSRDFWVYIYEANKSLIRNPDRIPTGIEIQIPKLDKRLIDKSNPRCVQKAKELRDLYVGKK